MSTCVAHDSRFPGAYGYQPSLAAGIVFVLLFFLSSVIHAFQAFRYRTPWLAFVVIGSFAESLGWIARTAAHTCVYSFVYFDMQIALLIMAPAWTTAGIYVILFKMIPILGPHTSPFPPKLCLLACFVVDTVSLTMQAVGGGLAGAANDAGEDMKPGTYTMVAGILFQLASTLAFTVLMSIVFLRGWKELLQSKPLRLLAVAMQISITCMVTRGIYRSVELLQGWTGYLNTHERFVIGLDAAIMVLAVVVLNIFNPGKLLAQARADKEQSIGEQVVADEPKSSPPTADSEMA